MSEFYQAGSCFCMLKTAKDQRFNKSIWREQLQREIWCKRLDEIMKAINELWINDGSCVNIWEEWWFPGIENFLNDLQQMGYHVYVGSSERRDNKGMTQRRYCVYLDELPGKKEWSNRVDLEVINCSDCQHYFYCAGEAGCDLDSVSYPELCDKFTPDS